MKRVSAILLAILMLTTLMTSCSSTDRVLQPYTEEQAFQARAAIRELLDKASQSAPESMFLISPAIGQLRLFLPSSAQGIANELDTIPGLKTECLNWLDAIYPICTTVVWSIPSLLERPIEQLLIPNPQAIVTGSTSSATALLAASYSKELEEQVKAVITESLNSKNAAGLIPIDIWNRIVTKYNIWRTAQTNLAPYTDKQPPQAISADMPVFLTQLVCDMFFTQMAIVEESIRTTRIPQDNSLVAKVFEPGR